jgi:propanediol dehydratase large subunit
MTLYLKDLKDSTKKLLDLINTFNKVAGYKISIQRAKALLYIDNIQAEKEIRKNEVPRNKLTKVAERLLQWNI